MNNNILTDEVQYYIFKNELKNITEISLEKSPFVNVSSKELAQQIKGRQISKNKFPILYKSNKIYYPQSVNLEQASSEDTAKFKKDFIKNIISGVNESIYNSENKAIDLTSGLGIDSFFISDIFKNYTLVDPDLELLNIVKHNYSILGKKVNFINQTAEKFLSNNNLLFDFILIDPSRRDSSNNKKFKLEDLKPNIVSLREELLKISENILIKLSPFVDIQQIINQIFSEKIIILSYKNETKEILCYLNRNTKNLQDNPEIQCINLNSSHEDFIFFWKDEKEFIIKEYKNPEKFIYIPNSSILKSGAFKLITNKYDVFKLANNTHIYTSEEYIENFPGRIFKILDINFDLKKSKERKFNIISKNYNLKPEEIKKKYKLIEGGNYFMLFTKGAQKYYTILMKLI